MRDRPILFSVAMVRAILNGSKSQTRRIVKPQPDVYPHLRPEPRGDGKWIFMAHSDRPDYQFATGDVRCPYGVPGDRLWVRETWANTPQYVSVAPYVAYRADYYPPLSDSPPGHVLTDGEKHWRPSIFMPRWASRITLEVTDVRVERLQEISEADCFAEGIQQSTNEGLSSDGTARGTYRALWESINGAGSWDKNPYVWVISFHRVGL